MGDCSAAAGEGRLTGQGAPPNTEASELAHRNVMAISLSVSELRRDDYCS